MKYVLFIGTAAIACAGSTPPERTPTDPAPPAVTEPEPVADAAGPSDAGLDDAPSDAPDAQSLGGLGLFGMGSADGGGFGRGSGPGFRGRGQPRAAVGIGSASTQGVLDKDVIRRVIRQNINRIRYCYEKELARDPALTARASPRFTIAADGSVTEASLSRSTGIVTLDDCVIAALRAMKFPPFDGGVVIVTYPFVFESAD